MKLLIGVDMEGISGVVSWDQVDPSHPEYQRFRKLMTQEVNAAIRGAWEAGVDQILVRDGHGTGTNILIEELDARASLHCGNPSPWAMMQGIENGVDAVFFIGYHARAGTENAILDHTWSSARVANLWLNERLVGETGLNAALCGSFGAPVLLVSGDQAVCAEAADWLPGVETVQVKRASGRNTAECLPLATAHNKIRLAAFQAIRYYNESNAPNPLVLPAPIKVTIEFLDTDMADRAAALPGVVRLDGRRLEISSLGMREAYQAFQAAVTLAKR